MEDKLSLLNSLSQSQRDSLDQIIESERNDAKRKALAKLPFFNWRSRVKIVPRPNKRNAAKVSVVSVFILAIAGSLRLLTVNVSPAFTIIPALLISSVLALALTFYAGINAIFMYRWLTDQKITDTGSWDYKLILAIHLDRWFPKN